MPANKFGSNSLNYKRWTLVVQNSINFLMALHSFLLQFLNLGIDFLQLLQLELHVFNAGLVKTFIGKL